MKLIKNIYLLAFLADDNIFFILYFKLLRFLLFNLSITLRIKDMKIDFGYIDQYNTKRGFGFVTCTLNKYPKKRTWFHIKKIKYDYPELAEKLDSGLSKDVEFWYEIDDSVLKKNAKEKCAKASEIWLDVQDIPEHYKDELIVYIEKIWDNIDTSLPEWLDHITISLLGSARQHELQQKRNEQIRYKQEVEEQEQIQNHSQRTRRGTQRRKRSRRGNYKPKLYQQRLNSNKDIHHVYIGLPEHLINNVLWVSRNSRTHIWSHIPGGSDVVVEYYNGRAYGYDWIKRPSAYIATFFSGEISTVYARIYNDDREYSTATFEEVWNAEKDSEEKLWNTLKKFDRHLHNMQETQEEDLVNNSYSSDEVWSSWYNTEENQWYFGECPECNIPDRD
ncbi:hypothetical protein PN462_14085 [Spirulina sp. CS-785/01]|uniref:hypothetical protein n=1 Tax=Spirulina sp. CS-785/01 TaxID=3021716 RepID=UPI00232F56C6|nr:hypothetical protein [Spirulina sp. CS-785/01]MDB9314238.1 hypothetical protein [Spirulina sp. CS-785/01]